MALNECANFQWHTGDELYFSVVHREFTPLYILDQYFLYFFVKSLSIVCEEYSFYYDVCWQNSPKLLSLAQFRPSTIKDQFSP